MFLHERQRDHGGDDFQRSADQPEEITRAVRIILRDGGHERDRPLRLFEKVGDVREHVDHEIQAEHRQIPHREHVPVASQEIAVERRHGG